MTTAASTTADLVDRWSTLGPEERLRLFHALPRDEADDFFLDLRAHGQAELIRAMPAGERRLWLRLLAPDDAADVVQEFQPELRGEILRDLDESTRSEVGGLLAYQEDVAGGRMSPRFARLRPDSTVDEAIAYLRRQAALVETIYYAYAVDDEQHLLGVVSLG
jgi:magnesium transporter